MKPETLCRVIDQLGGKYIASVTLQTLSGERFELLAVMSGATVVERVLMDDGGPVVVRSFERAIEGAIVTVEHRRPANLAELRESV